MITTAEEFLKLITVNKDRRLGKYDKEMSTAMFQDILKSYADVEMNDDQIESLFGTVDDFLKKYEADIYDKTNVEMHFVIQKESVTQYITPYVKEYDIGRTKQTIRESVIWIFRPEAITLGQHLDITNAKGRNHSLKEETKYTEGKAEEMFNIIVLHTYENYIPENFMTSTVHITVFIPVGNVFLREISQLHYEKQQREAQLHQKQKKKKKLKKNKYKK